ncbi:MAG: hypothetical protein AB8F94_23030 [Saprospiraceae bacterium]
MSVKFKIEFISKMGKKKFFVFVKCLEVEKDFWVTDNSKLNDVEISNYISKPRALDEKGKPRHDLYIFKIRYHKYFEKLTEGEIVELSLEK